MSGSVKEANAEYRSGELLGACTVGYKQTEVGVIPDDWVVSDIQSISSVPMQNGLFYEPARKGKGVGIINVGNLYKSAPIDIHLLEKFDATEAELKIFGVSDGDLFFTRSSIVPSGIAHCNIYYTENKAVKVVFDSHLIKVRINLENNDPRYIYLACLSKLARQHLIGSAKTATMTTIDQGAINKCPVLIPPKNEQTAIANALSDVDALITSLETIITKKRAIKTAAMQQLLTGKKRLPPFDKTHTGNKQTELGKMPEDWECAVLGNYLKIPATYGIVKAGDFKSTGVPMVRGGDIKNGKISRNYPFVSEEKSREYSRTILEKDDVLIALVGYPGEAAKIINDLVGGNISRAVGLLRMRDYINSDYIVCYLNSPQGRKNFLSPSAGSAQLVVNLVDLNRLMFPMPPYEEQKAIAEFVFDMGKDIDVLEKRLTKTQQLKQGMMQELLTGKTRLI